MNENNQQDLTAAEEQELMDYYEMPRVEDAMSYGHLEQAERYGV